SRRTFGCGCPHTHPQRRCSRPGRSRRCGRWRTARYPRPPRGEEDAGAGELLDARGIRDVDVAAPVGRYALGSIELSVARAQAPPLREEGASARTLPLRPSHEGQTALTLVPVLASVIFSEVLPQPLVREILIPS